MSDNLNITYIDDEYSSNDAEYYSYSYNYRDGGMVTYNEEYKNSIPGYIIFCKDEKEKNPKITNYELGYFWNKLKINNFEEYNNYILKYKNLYPNEYYEYVKKWKR